MMKKAFLTIFILIALISSVAALEVPLYQVEKVDVSLNILSGTQVSPSFCGDYEGKCTTSSGEIGGEPGILENCKVNTDVTVCHCDFLGCGTGASCASGDFQCLGSSYANGLPCPTPGIQTYYCESGICNYQGRCGAIRECNRLNQKAYQINQEIGFLSDCKATTDPLTCECDFTPNLALTTIANGDAQLPTGEIFDSESTEVGISSIELSSWDSFLIFLGLKDEPQSIVGGYYGDNPYGCQDGYVFCNQDCFRGTTCNNPPPADMTPPTQHDGSYPKCLADGLHMKCYKCSYDDSRAVWGDDGKYHCCNMNLPYFYDGLCHINSPGCIDECSQDGCSGTTFWYCYDMDGDGCNEKESHTLNFNNYDVYDGISWTPLKGSGTVACSNGILIKLYCKDGKVNADRDNCPSNLCETSTTCASNVCTPQASYKCYSGSIYYFDSCGVKGAMKEQCSSSCTAGSTQCNVPCEDECTVNTKQCVGSSQYQICQEDNVGCKKWSLPISCPTGQSCSNGYCQQTLEHLECKNNVCMKVPGAGTNQCTSEGATCGSHLECQNNMCVQVNTPGANTCSSLGASCGGEYHSECINEVCQQVSGPGDNTCTSNSDCEGGNFTTEAIIIASIVLLGGGFGTYYTIKKRKKKKKTRRSKK